MGLHLALLAKINLTSTTHMSLTTPILASLLGPFVLKFLFSTFRPLHQVFSNTVYASRLFVFQMGQITFNSEPAGNTRWQRALRLVNERLILARRSQVSESDEDSLRAFSVLAL